MNKYVIELRPDCKVVQEICESDGKVSIGAKSIEYLEELNADYVNEHFGDLQDTAYKKGLHDGESKCRYCNEYQRGFEDGVTKRTDGDACTVCKYSGTPQGDSPCFNCSNYYQNNWTAKSDKIEVGDIVKRYLNGKLDSTGIYLGEDGDYWNCLFWTGAVFGTFAYPKNQFKKTGRHFDIDKILEAMRT